MSRSHANPPRMQDQQDGVDSRQLGDSLGALHTANNEMEALHLVNQPLLRERRNSPKKGNAHRRHDRPMKVAIRFHKRNSNTSVPPETLKEEEKIAEPGSMILTYPPGMVTMRGCLVGTTEVMSQPLISRRRGNNLGISGSRTSKESSAT